MSGKMNEKVRATLICCHMRSSADAANFCLLLGLAGEGLDDLDAGQVFLQDRVERRQPALDLAEERLGDAAEDHEDSSASGSTGRMTSISFGLVNARMISAPTSRGPPAAVSSRPCPMNWRTFSTSSVARIISWPVWLRS